ncbi:hypothetical protein DXG01_010987 [Tephrocybe rancida]|nr:hypothetical protein DXG01_010987 [Tephrocybe rancida]
MPSYSSDGRACGFAHIEFMNLADAIRAVTSVAEEPMYLFKLDHDLRVHYAAPRRDDMPREPTNILYFTRFQ